MARRKRDLESYLESVKTLAPFIPSLKKYKKRKRLKPAEKSAIARKENILRQTYTQIDHLIPVSKRKARELRNILYEPETIIKSGKRKGQTLRHHFIQAVQLRNVGHDARILKKVDQNIFVVSNGRTWVYWKLPDVRPKALEKAGEAAFTAPDAYDIERVIELARQAFENPTTKGIYLWAESGRVGFPMKRLSDFVRWIKEDYSQYANTQKWVQGIAILVADVGEQISTREWVSFTPTREQTLEARKRNRSIYRRRRR